MMRWKPRRLLLAGALCIFPMALPCAALALAAPLWILVLAMLATGVGIEVFAVGWMLALHQEIPEDKMSRVSAYDWFGSVAIMPVGMALAGPAAGLFGLTNALWGCSGLVLVLTAAVLLLPDVRRLERSGHGPGSTTVAGAVGAQPAQPTVTAPSGGTGEGAAELL
jgi:MFS family permease